MKRMKTGMAWIAAAMLAALASISAQAAGQVKCAGGKPSGDLGISGLDCRGDCTLTMNEQWVPQAWSFSVEPLVTGVTPDGPADGVLRRGDALVAIDGLLITTAAGGRRYASVEPGEDVRIRFRRGGRMGEAVLHATATCALVPDKLLGLRPIIGRLTPLASDSETFVTPRQLLITDEPGTRTIRIQPGPTSPSDRVLPAVPHGRLGISFFCGSCIGTTKDGVLTWQFSGPIEVVAVDPGGPADKAGIQLGDQIKALNGKRIDSSEGEKIFAGITPGQPLELTVVKRSGQEVTVTVTPVAAETLRVPPDRPAPEPGIRQESR
jgi:hypothetical protein